MEQITYRQQIFWGTSLKMAQEDEIDLCYKYIKEQIEKTKIYYTKCRQAEVNKKKWMCGENIRNYPNCGKQAGILKEHLIEVIKKMVTKELNINEENIIDSLVTHGYIEFYPCNRAYFVK